MHSDCGCAVNGPSLHRVYKYYYRTLHAGKRPLIYGSSFYFTLVHSLQAGDLVQWPESTSGETKIVELYVVNGYSQVGSVLNIIFRLLKISSVI